VLLRPILTSCYLILCIGNRRCREWNGHIIVLAELLKFVLYWLIPWYIYLGRMGENCILLICNLATLTEVQNLQECTIPLLHRQPSSLASSLTHMNPQPSLCIQKLLALCIRVTEYLDHPRRLLTCRYSLC